MITPPLFINASRLRGRMKDANGLSNIGLLLMVIAVVIAGLDITGLFGLVSANYWTHEYEGNYRGFDIYFFTTLEMFAADTLGTNPDPATSNAWIFSASYTNLRGQIDNILDDPIFVETYNLYDIYREPAGAQRYFGIQKNTGVETSRWLNRIDLQDYIDTLVSAIAVSGLTTIDGDPVNVAPPIVVKKLNPTIRFIPDSGGDTIQAIAWFTSVGNTPDATGFLTKSGDAWVGTIDLGEAGEIYGLDVQAAVTGGYQVQLLETEIVAIKAFTAGISILSAFAAGLFFIGALLLKKPLG